MSICLLTVHHSPSMMILPSTWWRWKCMQEINFHTLKRLIQAQKQHSLFWTFPHSLQNAAICGTSKISFIIWNIKRSCFPYVSGMHFTKSITTFRRSQIWLAYKVSIREMILTFSILCEVDDLRMLKIAKETHVNALCTISLCNA